MSYTNSPEPKTILPIKRALVNWPQSVVTDKDFDRSFYEVTVSSFQFAAKYKQGDWLIAPHICAYSDYYYQIIGYALIVELRYGFSEKDKGTGIETQSQTTSAFSRDGANPIWYQFATYRRADHEMTDDLTSVKVLSVDYSSPGGWMQFDGPEVFAHIDNNSPDWARYYLENKSSRLKDQPPLPTYTPPIVE